MPSPPAPHVDSEPQEKFLTLVSSELDALKSKLVWAYGEAITHDGDAAGHVRIASESPKEDHKKAKGPICGRRFHRIDLDQPAEGEHDLSQQTNIQQVPGDDQSDIRSELETDSAAGPAGSEGQQRYGSMGSMSSTASQHQVRVREDWMVDGARARRIIESAECMSAAGLANLLAMEAGRVLSEVRLSESWGAARPSALGSYSSKSFRRQLSDLSYSEQGPLTNYITYYIRKCVPRLPFNPHSSTRLLWDAVGLLLVFYDAVMIPLILMVLPTDTDVSVMTIVTNTFWTADIVLTFLTATVIDGELKEQWALIVWQYLKSWFALDLTMVMPEWIFLVMNKDKGGFALLRILKSIRALRLLRVVKFENILREQLKRVNSESLLNTVSLLKLIFVFLMLNHFTACSWYLIGEATGDGWFMVEQLDRAGADAKVGYLLALHWSITQFHGTMELAPGNSAERVFAVIVLIAGMLTFSVMVSVSTDMIFQVRQARKKLHDQKMRLRSYFTRHSVSVRLMLSVKRHMDLRCDADKELEDDKEMLAALPAQLSRALVLEVRQPTIESHWLFTWMRSKYSTGFYDVCISAFVSVPVLQGHSLFSSTDACSSMYFIESGALRYLSVRQTRQTVPRTSIGPDSGFVKRVSRLNAGVELAPKQWICEPALWVQAWQTTGEMMAVINSVLLCLESNALAKAIKEFPLLHFDVAVYAHWVVQELKCSEDDHMLDLWVPESAGLSDSRQTSFERRASHVNQQ